ncbi:MAG: hypothetical protein N3A38_14040 [Planctomycetota bacterium]|nr:hypothetical protein [Planctomycetota bacterium]
MVIVIPPEPSGAPTILGLLMEPIPAGKIGRVRIGGLSPARVYVTDEDHQFAAPVEGSPNYLLSAATGPFRIVHKESGTGTKWAIVQLSAPGGDAVWG